MTDDNDTYLDRTAREALAHDLNTITTWLADDLDTVIAKQINYQGRGNTRSNESPWPMHLTASDASWDLINTLHAWIDTVVTQRHYPHPGRLRAAQAAKWLHQHLIALSLCENADQAADEIHHAVTRVRHIVDRPRTPEFVGPCQSDDATAIAAGKKITNPAVCAGLYCWRGETEYDCSTCGQTFDIPTVKAATEEAMAQRLFDLPDLRRALTMLVGASVPRQLVDGWIRQGRLIPRGGKYKLADALVLWAQRHSTRKTS